MIRASLAGFRLTAGMVPLLAGAIALGQEGDDVPFDRTPRDCVTISSIRQTDAIDDQNIIFRMRGNPRVYRNHLPRACPGLERENRISFRTSTMRLCSIDTITVLEEVGVGLRPGFTCRLGEFVPLSPAEVEELEALKDGKAGQSAIEASSIDLPEGGEPAATEGEPVTAEDAPAAEGEPDAAEPPDAEN